MTDMMLMDEPIALIDAETTDADLDADPEPNSITPGCTVRPWPSGTHWVLAVHGVCRQIFADFADAARACALATAEWERIGRKLHIDEPRPSAFEGHPAQEENR